MNVRVVSGSSGQPCGWVRPAVGLFFPVLALLLGLVAGPSKAEADDWGFAWEIGMITSTPQQDPFVFRLTATKYYSEEFGLGPSLYLTPYGDYGMYSGTLNAEFRIAMEEVHVSPFFGFGIAHRTTKHDDDTALMVPMGISADTPVGEKLHLIGTFSVNIHGGMTLDGVKDDASIGLTIGISYGP